MKLTPEYCRLMARYNGWQNRSFERALQELPLAELWRDHGADFGSILGTLNHVLWADALWMSRIAPSFHPAFKPPGRSLEESREMFPTLGTWSAERFRLDAGIRLWAERVKALELAGQITFHSATLGRDVSQDTAHCVVHMFNHQAHHRGQVHAMMTRAGLTAPVSDLIAMPDLEDPRS